MSVVTAMSSRPPPPTSRNGTRPKPPQKRPPPPPPPPSHKRPPPPPSSSHASSTTSTGGVVRSNNGVNGYNKRKRIGVISIRKPVELRDVNVFTRKNKLGEGTYGSVFKGADKETGEVVALKRINTEQEENGFPLTAIREVKILKALEHENIVKLKEIVTSKEQNGSNEVPRNVYMVFEYHPYDLTGILQSREISLSQDLIKSWSYQLLAGTHYMHTNKIIHRDLKASNILISQSGELKIADWGLARSWNESMKRLTNPVVTRWYRSIELMLGTQEYSPKIDMWSVGCIIAEMFRRDGLLKGGETELSQLQLIFHTCGHPDVNAWPDIRQKCPKWAEFEPRPDEPVLPNRLPDILKKTMPPSHMGWMTPNAIDLISNLLTYDPSKRWDAPTALKADYFWEKPIVKRNVNDLHMKLKLDSVHELAIKEKYMAMKAAKR